MKIGRKGWTRAANKCKFPDRPVRVAGGFGQYEFIPEVGVTMT
jgi:hypothetical protein